MHEPYGHERPRLGDPGANLAELPLFAQARAAADAAIAQADAHADPEWKEVAYATARALAAPRATFTADDIWAALPADPPCPATHDGRALGAVIQRARRDGLIGHSGSFAASTRRHLAPIPVWASRIHGEE